MSIVQKLTEGLGSVVRQEQPVYDDTETFQQPITDALKTTAEPGTTTGFSNVIKIPFVVVFAVCVILIFTLFCMSANDLVKRVSLPMHQARVVKIRQKDGLSEMPIKSSYELNYLSFYTNSDKGQPYAIYNEMKIINILYTVGGFLLALLGLALLAFLGLYVMSVKKGIPFIEQVKLPYKIIGLSAFIVLAGIIIGSIYKSTFLKTIQPTIINYRKKLLNINNVIYSNITDDAGFYTALKQGPSAVQNYVKSNNISQYSDCMAKMVVTYSLYEYFSSYINIADPDNADTIATLFTSDNVNSKTGDWSIMFKYDAPNYIPLKIWTVNTGTTDANALTNIEGETVNNDQALQFKRDVFNRLETINSSLTILQRLSSITSGINSYILINLFIYLAVLIVCIFAYSDIILGGLIKLGVMVMSGLRVMFPHFFKVKGGEGKEDAPGVAKEEAVAVEVVVAPEVVVEPAQAQAPEPAPKEEAKAKEEEAPEQAPEQVATAPAVKAGGKKKRERR